MVKKSIIGGIFALMIVSGTAYAYTDTEGHWAEKEINNLSLNGIISGYDDDSFRPDRNMTRAELVTVINRILGNSTENNKYVPDINAKDWFYSEIRKGIQSGIIQGSADGYIRPNDLVTREEAVVMIQRALVPLTSDYIMSTYVDLNEVSIWSKQGIATFLKEGYIKGYSDNTIRPQNYITRAEVVKIIDNIIGIYAVHGEYTGEIHGNLLVAGKNVSLSNITIDGDLIITEGSQGTAKIENIIIDGNLVIRTKVEIPKKNFKLKGKIVELTNEEIQNISSYINDDYGISFSIPEKANVIYITDEAEKINYKQKNLMTIRIRQSNDLYFTSFKDAVYKESERFDVPYVEMDSGSIGKYKYAVYGAERYDSYFLYLKRDNVAYTIYFYNIENINVIDSLVNSIKLYDGAKITPHNEKTYRNPDLYLKFSYIEDYVSVDDSYNTGVVNEEDAFFKMFIQVTDIIDMSEYTIEELEEILVSLEDSGSEIIETKVNKVYTYDAIEYTVKANGKLTKSLYVVISTKLYHFIFTGEEIKMNAVGLDMYEDIVNSIEF